MKAAEESCTGCRICEMICSITHFGKINSCRSRIRIESEWPEKEEVFICRKCSNPACVKECPKNALNQNDEGIIEIDREKCDLCENCIDACPFEAIFIGKGEKLLICDGCNGDYNCVEWCPNSVLKVNEEAVNHG